MQNQEKNNSFLPSWMCETEQYVPSIDKDGFITKSTQAVLVLKRSTDKFQRSSQVFSPQERLERAKKYLEKNSFMTQADYCQLTGLLKSAASRELREWIANPESGIDYKGRGTHKIYILRKP